MTTVDGISFDELERRHRLVPKPTKSREFRCPRCHSRCTHGTDVKEYGHLHGCPRRPGGLPRGGSRRYSPERDPFVNAEESDGELIADGGHCLCERDREEILSLIGDVYLAAEPDVGLIAQLAVICVQVPSADRGADLDHVENCLRTIVRITDRPDVVEPARDTLDLLGGDDR